EAECSNCGATHAPLWRRGLNDELNCKACGLYCKLLFAPEAEEDAGAACSCSSRLLLQLLLATPIPVAQCYNCHTISTPVWCKYEEGKTVRNACGLYYKLHGYARPISVKSDVIRKRSR
ncbi:hypothetical protein PENSPDRAFT_548054, partial [Peniophora sp. CONT]